MKAFIWFRHQEPDDRIEFSCPIKRAGGSETLPTM